MEIFKKYTNKFISSKVNFSPNPKPPNSKPKFKYL